MRRTAPGRPASPGAQARAGRAEDAAPVAAGPASAARERPAPEGPRRTPAGRLCLAFNWRLGAKSSCAGAAGPYTRVSLRGGACGPGSARPRLRPPAGLGGGGDEGLAGLGRHLAPEPGLRVGSEDAARKPSLQAGLAALRPCSARDPRGRGRSPDPASQGVFSCFTRNKEK